MTCPLCGAKVPIFGNVTWCDGCIDEFLDRKSKVEDMTAFIARKKEENRELLALHSPLA